MIIRFLSEKTINEILLTFKYKIPLIIEILDIIYIYLYMNSHRDGLKNKDSFYLII